VQGEFEIRGRKMNLGDITVPVLHVVAEHDHVVPAAASRDLVRLVASADKEEWVIKGGHVSLVDGVGAVTRTWPRLVDWRRGFVTFRDTSLAEAASEFNRYNARKIVRGDPAVGALRVGGNFRWSNVDAFVRLLEQGFPVRAETGTDRIVLHSL
jgi:ferric-dicitrate binding protein FerR (iron transport regulator)